MKIVRKFGNVANPEIEWTTLHPNAHGDWLNQRDEQFSKLFRIESEKKLDLKTNAFFNTYGVGVKTNRDSWVYNFSKEAVSENVKKMIAFYNKERRRYQKTIEIAIGRNLSDFLSNDSKQIAWSSGLIDDLAKDKEIAFRPENVRVACYRPFCKQYLYFDKHLTERPALGFRYFPSDALQNPAICVSGIGMTSAFSVIATDTLPDVQLNGNLQCFPLHYYEQIIQNEPSLFNESLPKYIEHSALSDFILGRAREAYGPKLTKEDLFYFVYGFLHSPDYRERYSADLRKTFPRLPLVDEPKDFWAFSKAGRALADLHINYESVQPYPLIEVGSCKSLAVDKMRFPSKVDKSSIVYNSSITLRGIPEEAYEYVVNGRSAIEWVMERYQVRIDKDSGIKNDPNDWCREVGDSRYIIDLVKRVVTVAVETMKIVKKLPKWSPSK